MNCGKYQKILIFFRIQMKRNWFSLTQNSICEKYDIEGARVCCLNMHIRDTWVCDECCIVLAAR